MFFKSRHTISTFSPPTHFQSTSAWFFSLHSAEAGLTKVTNDLLSDKSHRHFPFPLWTSPQCLALKDGTVQCVQMPALLLAVFWLFLWSPFFLKKIILLLKTYTGTETRKLYVKAPTYQMFTNLIHELQNGFLDEKKWCGKTTTPQIDHSLQQLNKIQQGSRVPQRKLGFNIRKETRSLRKALTHAGRLKLSWRNREPIKGQRRNRNSEMKKRGWVRPGSEVTGG